MYVGFLPLLLCLPFLLSPAFFWSLRLRLTNDALPFGPSLRAFSALKQAAYAPPSFPPPHLPNFCPSEPYLSQPPLVVPPAPPLPTHFLRSSLVIEPQSTQVLSSHNSFIALMKFRVHHSKVRIDREI